MKKTVDNCSVPREIQIKWNDSPAGYLFSNKLTETSAYNCPFAAGDLSKEDKITVTTMAGVIATIMCNANCRNRQNMGLQFISPKLYTTQEPD